MPDADDFTPDFLDWLLIDALARERREQEETKREQDRKELERIFGPGWFDDVRKTIEELEERDRRAAVDRVN